MTVAEFFIKLGIKGGDASSKQLGNVNKGLKNITSTSLEAKAAILAVFYGLSKLTTNAADHGQALKNFANYTNLSTDALQRWQYMAKLSGGTADDMQSSVVSVNQAMAKLKMGQGAPAGLERVGNTVGIDMSKIDDTFYVMDKLRAYARTSKEPAAIVNEALASFGLTPQTIAVLRTSAMDLSKIGPGKLLSGGQIEQLSKVKSEWEGLWHNMDIFMQKMVAKDGLKLVKDLSMATDQAMKLVAAFVLLAEKAKALEWIGIIFEGWANIFKLAADGIDALSGKLPSDDKSKKKMSFKDSMIDKTSDALLGLQNIGSSLISPFKSQQMRPATAPGRNINMTNNITNNGVKDAQDANTLNQRTIENAFFQSPATVQGQ